MGGQPQALRGRGEVSFASEQQVCRPDVRNTTLSDCLIPLLQASHFFYGLLKIGIYRVGKSLG